MGLGGVLPNVIALAAESAPRAKRAMVTSIVIIGMSLGSGMPGVVAAKLIPAYGWESLFIVGGVLNAFAHFLAIEAMRAGEAALVAPFRYTALVWASVVGFLVWGHVPSVWVLLGASVIAASGICVILMERRAKRLG